MAKCEKCGEKLNTWDQRCGEVLGYKLCEKCIAKEYSVTVGEFRDKLEEFFGIRPCQGI